MLAPKKLRNNHLSSDAASRSHLGAAAHKEPCRCSPNCELSCHYYLCERSCTFRSTYTAQQSKSFDLSTTSLSMSSSPQHPNLPRQSVHVENHSVSLPTKLQNLPATRGHPKLYPKESGSQQRVNKMHQDGKSVSWSSYQIHVMHSQTQGVGATEQRQLYLKHNHCVEYG